MDENESQGGLAQAVAPPPVASQPLAAAPAAKPEPSEYEKALASYQQQKQQLIEQQRRLVDSLESRIGGPAESLFALSAGFGKHAPSFGEGFGNAMGAYGAQQTKSRQEMSDIAKMRLDLEMQQLGMRKEDVELAGNREAARRLQQIIGGATGSAIPPNIAASVQLYLARGNVKAAQDIYDKYVLESNKEPEKIKELKYYMSQLQSPAARSVAQQLAANNYFLGNPVERTKVILDIQKQVDERIIPASDGNILIQRMTSIGGGIGGGQGAPAATGSDGVYRTTRPTEQEALAVARGADAAGIPVSVGVQQGAVVAPASTTPGISPRQDRDIRAKIAETEGVDRAKSRTEDRDALKKGNDEARGLINDANAVFDLAEKNPAAMGVLSKPGIGNAVLLSIENAIRVGNFSIGMADLQTAIRNAGGTQQDIDAAAAVGQIAVRLSLALAEGVKGSVSNYEQGLFQQASFSKNDSPLLLKYKSELMRARGEIQKFLWNKYLEFEKTGKGNIEDFKSSREYQSYKDQYDASLTKIRNTYFKSAVPSAIKK
jgi:hypothetical protein